ncbi:MAG: polyphosphate polymerase domain-containing protein [Clostridia bacterium]|nr:polyphosphate polymerase domain-containing protein [Clostridia bacterium]
MSERSYRYEQKYLISRQAAVLLKYRLASVMDVDPHAAGGSYHIRSLYFDDAAQSAFLDKVNGVDERSKFRIRHYNFDPSMIRLEKKEKNGFLSRITSAQLDADTARLLASKELLSPLITDNPLIRELLTLREATLLRPIVYVDYDRIPFVCSQSNTRITIDSNIAGAVASMNIFDRTHTMLPAMPEDFAILEVKYDEQLPSHLLWLLEDVPMQVQALSKYCLCLSTAI